MSKAISSEFRKLFSTTTPWWLLAGMLFLAGPGIFLAGQSTVDQLSRPLNEQVWFFIAAGFTRLLTLILGIRLVTDEFRHGTIIPTTLAIPRRARVLAAKAVTAGTVGFLFTVLAEIVMLGAATLLISSKGADLNIDAGTVKAMAGMAVAGGLWAAFGTGLGAILRRQVLAVVGALLWLMPGGGFEDMIRNQIGKAGDYLPGNQGMALALGPEEVSMLVVASVLLAYTVAVFFVGVALTSRRDV